MSTPLATLDIPDLFERGDRDFGALTAPERLVYLLQELDVLADMEGWEHFFLHEHHFVRYPELRAWLHEIGDDASLAVLDEYEAFVASCGAPFTPDGIRRMLEEAVRDDAPDFRARFTDLREERWTRVERSLADRGWRIG